MMFPNLKVSSFQGVLLAEHIILNLGEVRSIFTLASDLIDIYLVVGPRAFIKVCFKSGKEFGSLSDFMSQPMFRAMCLYLG